MPEVSARAHCRCIWLDVTGVGQPPASQWIKGADDPNCAVHCRKPSESLMPYVERSDYRAHFTTIEPQRRRAKSCFWLALAGTGGAIHVAGVYSQSLPLVALGGSITAIAMLIAWRLTR